MNWKIRHEGSTVAVEGMTLEQIVEGLNDGLWAVTDEVMGPADSDWAAIENHPQLAEMAEDLTAAEAPAAEEEVRLDMNALIDVTLVLLIFFIMTSSYVALQRLLDLPDSTKNELNKGPLVKKQEDFRIMIKAEIRRGPDGEPLYKVEGKEVNQKDLVKALAGYKVGEKSELLVDCADDVPVQGQVTLLDAARGAGILKVYNLSELPPPIKK